MENENTKHEPESFYLKKEETELIKMIRSGKYQKLTILFKASKMKAIEMEMNIDPESKLSDVLKENDCQVITLKRHKGRTAAIKNKTRIIF